MTEASCNVVHAGSDDLFTPLEPSSAPPEESERPVLFLKRGKGTGFDAAVIEHTSFPDLLEGLTRVIDGTMDPEEP